MLSPPPLFLRSFRVLSGRVRARTQCGGVVGAERQYNWEPEIFSHFTSFLSHFLFFFSWRQPKTTMLTFSSSDQTFITKTKTAARRRRRRRRWFRRPRWRGWQLQETSELRKKKEREIFFTRTGTPPLLLSFGFLCSFLSTLIAHINTIRWAVLVERALSPSVCIATPGLFFIITERKALFERARSILF